MFQKKKQEKKITKTPEQQFVENLKVYRIPDKYLSSGESRKKSESHVFSGGESGSRSQSGKKWLFIGVGIFVFLLAVVCTIFFMLSATSEKQKNQQPPPQRSGESGGLVEDPEESVQGDDTGDEDGRGETDDERSPDEGSGETDVDTGDEDEQDGTVDEDLPEALPQTFSAAPDRDEDGLSDAEEELYNTHPAKKDTDNDGFMDGEELKNLYDPDASGATLSSAVSVKRFDNSVIGDYFVLFPARWSVIPSVSIEETASLFTSEQGDSVRIDFSTLSTEFEKWYEENGSQDHDFHYLALLKVNDTSVFKTSDGLTYFLVFGDRVYVITYDPSGTSVLHYFTTLEMMVKSFSRSPQVS